MQLNLPILHHLKDCKSILIAGAGGGFDIFAGLPLYFTLREQGKTVHLANYSFTSLPITKIVSQPEVLIDTLLMGARGSLSRPFAFYPEGYLAQWFEQVRGEAVTIWMFSKTGVEPLAMAYETLIDHLGGVDTLILVDGGVDSIMRGDEASPGSILEDTISLAAASKLSVAIKIMTCIGFGTEVEETVCHHHALENIAALARQGAFWGSCALTPQMEAFKLYEAACRYVWEQPKHPASHISTRIIPAVNGEFGDYHLYDQDKMIPVLISPLMSLYWFFDAHAVIRRNLFIDKLKDTLTVDDALNILMRARLNMPLRPRQSIPY